MSSAKTLAAAYATAKAVFVGSLKRADGARFLHDNNGVNLNSAKDFIDAYKHLRKGESFQRTLSRTDMDFYLASILADDGPSELQLALHALWRHIAYYERTHSGKMKNLRSVHSKYQLVASAPRSLEEVSTEFDKQVKKALSDSPDDRRKR